MRPAIIDPTIDTNIQNGTYAMLLLPDEVENYDPTDRLECRYAEAMHYLATGETQKGKELLEINFGEGHLESGKTLAYGYSTGWFGTRDWNTFCILPAAW